MTEDLDWPAIVFSGSALAVSFGLAVVVGTLVLTRITRAERRRLRGEAASAGLWDDDPGLDLSRRERAAREIGA